MLGCKPEEPEIGKYGTIYGTVTDYSSGNPINNANVRLNPRGETTLTGSDGRFQFNDLAEGSYSLSLSKNGYVDLDDDYVIKIENGNSISRDVQMQKEQSSLKIVDNDGNTVSELDFGNDAGLNQKTFSIFNNGNITLEFTITKTSNWIDEVVPSTGTVSVGDTKPIYVIINRDLLGYGENRTNLLITTPNAGGIELEVKAKKSSNAPEVLTMDVTNITAKSASCGGNVISDGGSDVTSRGICWNTSPHPTINNSTATSGSGIGAYSCNMTNLQNNTTYYVRAYANNSAGISYGEEKSFTTEAFPTFQYGGYTYYVAPDPGNYMEWSAANSYCNNLSLEGMTGWKMPTRDELVQMYADRNSIGGFSTAFGGTGDNSNGYFYSAYWSSTTSTSSYHYYVTFSNGTVCNPPDTYYGYNRARVRPIRRKN